MECYALTVNNFGKVREVFNGGGEYILPQSQAIKETSFVLTINKMLRDCVGKVGRFKISDAVVASIRRSYSDNMVLNPGLDILSIITHHGLNFQ